MKATIIGRATGSWMNAFVVAIATLLVGDVAQADAGSAPTAAERAQALRAQTDCLMRAVQALEEAAAGRAELFKLAAEREATMLELIEAAPAVALQNAMPIDQRDGLPASVQQRVEQMTTETGTLEVRCWLAEDGSMGYRRYLVMGDRRLHLSVEGISGEYLSGTVVTVRGILLGDRMAATKEGLIVRELPKMASRGTVDNNGITVQTALVININFADRITQPWSLDFVTQQFARIANWFREGSFNQMTLAADVAGWFTIAASYTSCDMDIYANQAEEAARAAGYEPNNYDHVVLAFPLVPSCGWVGWAELPGRHVWLNNGVSHIGVAAIGVAAHELGHNLGLWHSHTRTCSDGPLDGTCQVDEYGDRFDVMGNAPGGAHYHGSYRAYLGWIPASDVRTLTPSDGEVVVALHPAESSFGTRVLRVQRSGLDDYLNVESRDAVGFDEVLATYPRVLTGVEVYLSPSMSEQSIVNVAYMSNPYAGDEPLQFGDTLYDIEGNVSITALYELDRQRYVCVHYDLSTSGCSF